MNRRTFLATTLAGAASLSVPVPLRASQTTRTLRIVNRTIEVNGRAADVFGLVGPDGRPGLTFDAGSDFDVRLVNEIADPTLVHWHGLKPPYRDDGVPGLPSPELEPGGSRDYRFPVGEGGTHWMHAHSLQEQNLLAAPLIVRTAEDRASAMQEIAVLLHDFSFTPAEELLAGLRGGGMGHGGHDMGGQGMADMGGHDMGGHGGHDMGGHGGHDMGGQGMAGMAMDLNDIRFDAYLANDRTLDDPEVYRVEKGGTVRLRLINGATATAFTIDLGTLEGTVLAVDGQPVQPAAGRMFPLTMGQRIDLAVKIPAEGGSFPILALREGAPERTGIVLATAGAAISRVAAVGTAPGPVLDLAFESKLRAAAPLAQRSPDRVFAVDLAGTMAGYAWSLPGAEDIVVRRGERVEIAMRNVSMMAHPMHLHGHVFQVVAIDGTRVQGAVRDTVIVPPMRTVTIAVDADNPGRWAFHCHHLYHMAGGMMAEFAYEGVA